jgi:hypothetical protein
MAPEKPSPSRARLSRWLVAWRGRSWLPRSPWPYVLAGAALLALSQLLWLWHSWPVREILNAERPVAEGSI